MSLNSSDPDFYDYAKNTFIHLVVNALCHAKVGLPFFDTPCSNTGSIRDDPYWTSRKNSLELIEVSSINKCSLV